MGTIARSINTFKVSEIELVYKSSVKPSERLKISCSRDAYTIFKSNWDENKIGFVEQFFVLLLNRANKVLGIVPISSGGISGTVADPKLVFAAALKTNSSYLILAHNHPSGNLKPSEADRNLTKQLKEAGRFLDLPVLDHLIITTEGYFSFTDEGLL